MLQKVHEVNVEAARTSIGQAAWPRPFPQVLEYNSAAHGPWNIVHTGMLVPGAHQIYVCADNCSRGVVLTAAEMGAGSRFSSIRLTQEDLLDGQMEELVIDGVREILDKLPVRPRIVILFTVCIHRFMGSDIDYIFRELGRLCPDTVFIRGYMDCIAQKEGPTPDQKLRASIYDCLAPQEKEPGSVCIYGNDLPLDSASDLMALLKEAGRHVFQLPLCRSEEEFLDMSRAALAAAVYPPARYGMERFAGRMGIPGLYLPVCFGYKEIAAQLRLLAQTAGLSLPEERLGAMQAKAEQALALAGRVVGQMPVAIDSAAFPRVLSLARCLLEHGFRVIRIYADAFLEEEKEDFLWLRAHAPETQIYAVTDPAMRVMPRRTEGRVLAIGQKAAYFTGTGNFVNVVENGGMWGFDGICRLAGLMADAVIHEKDTRDIVSRKGLGLPSLVEV